MQSQIKQRLEKDFQGKKVLIVGLGVQGGGAGLAAFLSEIGASVTVTDLKSEEELSTSLMALKNHSITYRLGSHKSEDFINADYIFKGPSVSWSLPEIKEAQKKGIPVDMEAAYFTSLFPSQVIGVTGTRGKSTTSQMIYEMLKTAGKKTVLGGNVRNLSTIGLLNEIEEDALIVLELSSWQLSGFHKRKISPHIAVFTSFYPDHLNYYSSMDEYFHDKSAVYLYQKPGDFLIAHKTLRQKILNSAVEPQYYSYYVGSLQLKGEHNKENAEAAAAVGRILKINEDDVRKTLALFKGMPFRQEAVRTVGKTTFINDTTSTTPVATIKAIDTYSENPSAFIIGGTKKNLPFEELIRMLGSVAHITLLNGTFTQEIEDELRKRYKQKVSPVFHNLKDAILDAWKSVENKNGSYVVFSPGAASFEMFNNEFHRGDEFNRIVKDL